jgi:hypothetical protein
MGLARPPVQAGRVASEAIEAGTLCLFDCGTFAADQALALVARERLKKRLGNERRPLAVRILQLSCLRPLNIAVGRPGAGW